MARTATLKVYSGSEWQAVTGRIIRITETGGVIIDDERGVRYFAMKDRATVHNDNDASFRSNTLW